MRCAGMAGTTSSPKFRQSATSGVRDTWGGRAVSTRKWGGWHPGVPRFSAHVADGTTPRVVDLGECEEFLASTGRSNRRWDRRQLQMPQDTCDHRRLGEDGNDPERATTAKRTGAHI